MKKIFNLAVIFAALMTAVSFTSCTDEDSATDKTEKQALESVDVQAGETYAFTNTSIANADGTLGKSGFFKVISVEGTAGNKVVELKITTKKDDAAGGTYFLGDDNDHTSYLLWDGEKYINAKQADAVANAAKVIFCLSSASEKYTITSGTVNNAVKGAGATKTTFAID